MPHTYDTSSVRSRSFEEDALGVFEAVSRRWNTQHSRKRAGRSEVGRKVRGDMNNSAAISASLSGKR